ncbi:hypothetical protein Nepgr_015963 [Nepenthes gracilis]|uniref:Uncharacterized protein n=1 Tax=Nepenthes gracilis TaxID=150966 RepID=A0AAD3SMZ6_NEPGR|nr:hypothetical protein Nepgr_015963 [Nepenthes gracilis]
MKAMADAAFKVGELLITVTAGIAIVLFLWHNFSKSNATGLSFLLRRFLSLPFICFILNFVVILILLSSNFTSLYNLITSCLINNKMSSSSHQSHKEEVNNWSEISAAAAAAAAEEEEEEDCFSINCSDNQPQETASFDNTELKVESRKVTIARYEMTEEAEELVNETPNDSRQKEEESGEEAAAGDTMEATWNAIMENKRKAAAQQMKSGTWRSESPLTGFEYQRELNTLETFNEARKERRGTRQGR